MGFQFVQIADIARAASALALFIGVAAAQEPPPASFAADQLQFF